MMKLYFNIKLYIIHKLECIIFMNDNHNFDVHNIFNRFIDESINLRFIP